MSRHSASSRIVSCLCAVLFLAATGSGPYGLHRCPHHDAPGALVQEGHGARPAAGSAHEDGSHHEPGPCTCVNDCDVTADAPTVGTIAGAVSLPAAHLAITELPSATGIVLGPRHSLFSLHRPNAPPTSL